MPVARQAARLRALADETKADEMMLSTLLPDLANFWNRLEASGLVGTAELPLASQVCDTVERAAGAVRALLGRGA